MPTQKFLSDGRRGNIGVGIAVEHLEKRGLKVKVIPDVFFQDHDIEVYKDKQVIRKLSATVA